MQILLSVTNIIASSSFDRQYQDPCLAPPQINFALCAFSVHIVTFLFDCVT